MAGERALVLVPCSGGKASRPSDIEPGNPIPGVEPLRKRMVELKGDITSGRTVPAVSLYSGALYKKCWKSMEAVVSGQYPDVDLLIVSAYYGLVHPAEPIADYNLHMGNEVAGMKVYRHWQRLGLSAVLEAYVREQRITHIWSLLSDSHPRSQYRQSLNPFWKNMKGKVIIRQVTVPGDGQNNSYRRGEWLDLVLTYMPGHLVEDNPVSESVQQRIHTDENRRKIAYL